jgi:hypothetical protein
MLIIISDSHTLPRFARHFRIAPTRLTCGQEPRPFIVLSATNTGERRCSLTSDRPYIFHMEREGGKGFCRYAVAIGKKILGSAVSWARGWRSASVPSAWQMTHPCAQLTADPNTFTNRDVSYHPPLLPLASARRSRCNTHAPLLPPATTAAAAHPESNSCLRCFAAPALTHPPGLGGGGPGPPIGPPGGGLSPPDPPIGPPGGGLRPPGPPIGEGMNQFCRLLPGKTTRLVVRLENICRPTKRPSSYHRIQPGTYYVVTV